MARARSRRAPAGAAAQAARQIAERERRGIGVSTLERLKHSGAPLEIAAGSRAQRIAMAPLDRLAGKSARGRPLLSRRQYEAGERLRDDGYLAGFMRSAGMLLEPIDRGYAPSGPAFADSERAAAAMRRLRKAQAALGRPLSVVLEAVIWPENDVMTMSGIGKKLFNRNDATAAEAATIEVVKIALETLADHYEGRR